MTATIFTFVVSQTSFICSSWRTTDSVNEPAFKKCVYGIESYVNGRAGTGGLGYLILNTQL